jgi:hypothetical protein
MINNRKELSLEIDMLKGNINRMCLANDYEELEKMYTYAKIRLDAIYSYNYFELKKEEDK